MRSCFLCVCVFAYLGSNIRRNDAQQQLLLLLALAFQLDAMLDAGTGAINRAHMRRIRHNAVVQAEDARGQ